MKLETLNSATVIQISDLPRLDPITLMVQDLGPGQGRVIVECYGEAWSAFWGSMPAGFTTLDFIKSMDCCYLRSKLSRPKQTMAQGAYLDRIVDAIYSSLRENETPRPDQKAREECISIIEAMFPADCEEYPDVAAIGCDLLDQARAACPGGRTWRDESLEVLRIYADLCVERDNHPQLRKA